MAGWLFGEDARWAPMLGLGALLVVITAAQWLVLKRAGRRAREHARAWRSSRERQLMQQHESLVQGMLGVMMQFHAFAANLPEEEAMRAAFRKALAAADRVLADTERGAVATQPYPQGSNLATALVTAAEGLATADSPPVEVTATGDLPSLPEPVLVEAFRVAREAIANALRHAHASKVSVSIAYRPPELRVRIQDDGCGLRAHAQADPGATGGLNDMRKRSADLQGSLSVVSVAGSGTDIEFRFDVERAAELAERRRQRGSTYADSPSP